MGPPFDIKKIETIFSNRGIWRLFHANAVETSISFFKLGALLSRKAIEDLGSPQSPQASDTIDKKYGIYGDIFLNCHDMHRQFKKPNSYGPITFAVDIRDLLKLLKSKAGSRISITKENPIYWKDTEFLGLRTELTFLWLKMS